MIYYITYNKIELELDFTDGGIKHNPIIPHMEAFAKISRHKKKDHMCLFSLQQVRYVRKQIAKKKIPIWGMGSSPTPGLSIKRNLQHLKIHHYQS